MTDGKKCEVGYLITDEHYSEWLNLIEDCSEWLLEQRKFRANEYMHDIGEKLMMYRDCMESADDRAELDRAWKAWDTDTMQSMGVLSWNEAKSIEESLKVITV